ncbi:MAG: type IVB secretion system protein IcmH/DotU [Gammaproteobacteria bacterium]|nr:type IVB secretion system protein IcmH/DotU [Gammaproteobacteria bacterium]
MKEFDKPDTDQTVLRGVTQQNPDRTTLRPAPGRRAAIPTPGRHDNTQFPASATAPLYRDFQSQVLPGAGHIQTYRGLNPLVNAASTLLALFVKLRSTFAHSDVNGLFLRLSNEIKAFESRAKNDGERPEIVLAARYVLCAGLDEAVLKTPWGSESAWTQRSLLNSFHNETGGGEKFFMILDRMREMPVENLHMLELMYLCLSLGFRGKYDVVQNGRDHLENIRHDLFQTIRGCRGEFERELSPTWQSRVAGRNKLTDYVPFWVIASSVAALLMLVYFGFRVWMYNSSSYVEQQLVDIVESAEQSINAGKINAETKAGLEVQ